ncbi:hypothetical protein NC652_020383 [Populus alba x Populus x berolinensis]|nr:hypothetical protein NC652_020383 [Populus alba x Populus x berolinensis]
MSSSQHSYAKGTLLVNIGYAVTSFYCLQSSLMSLGPWTDVERGTVAIISFKVSRAAFRTSEVMDMVVSTPLFYHGKEPEKKRNRRKRRYNANSAFEGQTKYQVLMSGRLFAYFVS